MAMQLPADVDDEDVTPAGFLREPRQHHSEPARQVSAAVHTIRLRRIWGDIQSFIYPIEDVHQEANRPGFTVAHLRQRLRDWLEQRPGDLGPGDNNHGVPFGSDKWFLLSFHHSILLLHRRRLIASTDTDTSATGEASHDLAGVYLECAESAATIARTYQELYLGTAVSTTWGALHVLFLGGLTFLHCLWASKEVRQSYRRDAVSAICTSCTIVLVVMAERWSAAAPYRDAFNALAAATQSMLVDGDSAQAVPSLPVLDAAEQGNMAKFLSGIEEIGMCDSVEHLLGEMV